MAQHGSLRLPGRAAREQQDGDVLRVDERQVVVDRRRLVAGGRQELVGRDDLDAVVWLEAPHDVGSGNDDARREAGDDAVQLVVGQAVVDRRERQPGERGAEQRDRHRLGVEIDHPDVLDAA